MKNMGYTAKYKGLAVAAGAIMAAAGAIFLISFLRGAKDFSSVYPYISILRILSMAAFVVIILIFANDKITLIVIPTGILLLLAGFYSLPAFLGVLSGERSEPLLESAASALLPFVALVLFILNAVFSNKLKFLLVLTCILTFGFYSKSYLINPQWVVDIWVESGAFSALSLLSTSLMILPILLLSMSLGPPEDQL